MSSVRSKFWGVSFVLVACAVAGSVWLSVSRAGAAPASQPQLAGAQRIEQLRAERHKILERLVESAKARAEYGLNNSQEYHEAVLALRQAELESAKTPAERIRVHEQIVDYLRQREAALQSVVDRGGAVYPSQVQKAKADRLKAEIDLEEAKLTVK